MIFLMLRFSFKAGTTPERKESVLAAMRRTSQVESTSFSFVGPDLGDPAEGYTHGYCVALQDLDALDRYMYDPVHLEGDFEILPHLSRLTQIRLSDDADPDLNDKIFAMHRKKLATYPEWDRLLGTIPGGGAPPVPA
jgi:Stress responsive A/B Barrel Domain